MILVVIPSFNEAPYIEATIDVLSVGLPANREVLFVVADGGSTDGTTAIVEDIVKRRSDVRLLNNPNRLQSAGINLAVEVFGTNADILVRCDAHSLYPEGYIAALVETLARTAAESVVVSMVSIGKNCFQRAVAWVSDTPIGSGGSAHRAGRESGYVDHGHHAAIRVAAFRATGGYDPTYSHNEDAEFDCRLVRLGGRVFLDAKIQIGYWPRDSIKALARQYFNYGRGRSRTIRRHPGSIRLRQAAVPAHCVIAILSLFAGALISPWYNLYLGVYVGVLCLSAGIIALKNWSICGFLAAPAAITMHFAWAFGLFVGFTTLTEVIWRPEDARAMTPLDSIGEGT